MTEAAETFGERAEAEVTKTGMQKLLRLLLLAYLAAMAGFCIWQRKVMFAWPAGLVTGNLLASAIWAPLALIHLDNVAIRHHKERLAQARAHHLELVALHRLHHNQLKAHVTALMDSKPVA